MKLTSHFHQVPRLRCVEFHLQFPTRLRGVVLKHRESFTFLFSKLLACFGIKLGTIWTLTLCADIWAIENSTMKSKDRLTLPSPHKICLILNPRCPVRYSAPDNRTAEPPVGRQRNESTRLTVMISNIVMFRIYRKETIYQLLTSKNRHIRLFRPRQNVYEINICFFFHVYN